jgi:glycosyltransferase involved in cell wall biosynthesis
MVSVIVPAYNMAEYTVGTVESLLAQTYPRVEIIVVDDGSRDDTGSSLQQFADRITYVYQENRGACSARNRGYHLSKGDFIGFLDCDDLYHPEKIERFMSRFRSRPRIGMVYSPEYLVDENDRVYGINGSGDPQVSNIFFNLLKCNFIGSSTPIVRREALDEVGLWDEKIFTTADWDLWLRISRFYETDYIERALSYSRQVSLYNQRNVVKTQREAYYVLDKLKGEGVAGWRLRVSKSNIDLLLHRYDFDNRKYRNSLRHLVDAIRANPIQLKGYVHLVLFSLFRPLYRKVLEWRTVRKINRYPERKGAVNSCTNSVIGTFFW